MRRCSLAILLLVCVPLAAAPLNRRELPADVRWFAHADLDGARDSDVCKTVQSLLLDQPGPREWVAGFRDATGADALTDFHGVTVFNTSFATNQGIAVIRGNVDRDRMVALVAGLPDHQTAAHRSYEVHLWTDPKTGRTSAGAFRGKDTVVLGSDPDAVRAELDLLDGKGKALAGEKSALNDPASPGAVIEIGAGGLSGAPDLPFESPIVKQADNLMLSLGEKGGRAFVHGRLVLHSAEVASQVRALLDGMRALAVLKSGDRPALSKFLSALRVTADERAVRVDLDADSRELARGIREQAEKKPEPTATQNDRGQ